MDISHSITETKSGLKIEIEISNLTSEDVKDLYLRGELPISEPVGGSLNIYSGGMFTFFELCVMFCSSLGNNKKLIDSNLDTLRKIYKRLAIKLSH